MHKAIVPLKFFVPAFIATAIVASIFFGTSLQAEARSFPGLNGKILFTSDRSGVSQLYTMNSDGSSVASLTNITLGAFGGRWSPDGKRIAFVSAGSDNRTHIFVMNANGSGITQLTNTPQYDHSPAWSPEGDKLAFVRFDAVNNPDDEIWTMNADGTGQADITNDPGPDIEPAWSPLGDKIAYAHSTGGLSDVFLMNPDGSDKTNLTNFPAEVDDEPTWSSDGSILLFRTTRDGNGGTIYAMLPDGSSLTPIQSDNVSFSEFSSDTNKIVWGRAASNFEIYTMNSDGTNPVNITNNASSDSNPDWQPLPQPDLVVSKTNNLSGANATTGVEFSWNINFVNNGREAAEFAAGDTVLLDYLPSAAMYGVPTVTLGAGALGSLDCQITWWNGLLCMAGPSGLTIPKHSSISTVFLPTTPTAAGSLTNPSLGNSCKIDPNNVIIESDENYATSNGCHNTVNVVNVAPTTGTLFIKKHVINDSGGTKVASDFTLFVRDQGTGVTQSLFQGSEDGVAFTEPPGQYEVEEMQPQLDSFGYTNTNVNDCFNLTVTAGATTTCTMINDDNGPTVTTAKVTLLKEVTNDDGGTAESTDFTLVLGKFHGSVVAEGVMGSPEVTNVEVEPGLYTIFENSVPGYAATSRDCVVNGQPVSLGSAIQFSAGDVAICTIKNDDLHAALILQKIVVNDSGGSAVRGDWTLIADGPTPFSGASASFHGVRQDVEPGEYTISESGPSGYTLTNLSCSSTFGPEPVVNNKVEILPTHIVACILTNDDDIPPPQIGTLTLIKHVINDNGGTDPATAWTLFGNGSTTISGQTGSVAVTNAVVTPGEYSFGESGPNGYTASDWSCDKGSGPVIGSTVTINTGDNVTCTITNNDNPRIDLTATKSNTLGGLHAIVGQAFNWRVAVKNGGVPNAEIPAGVVLLRDNLPSGATYSSTAVQMDAGVTGSASCVVDATNTLVCTTTSILAIPSLENIYFLVSATPNAAGTLTNPKAGGICQVDPDGSYVEIDESNNNCNADTVTVDNPAPTTGGLIVEKHVTGGFGTFNFSAPGLSSFSISTDFTSGSYVLSNVLPGTYHITEASTTNWRLQSNECANVTVTAGATTTCVVANINTTGTLIVRKTTIGGDGTFNFSAPGLTSFSITTSGGGGGQSMIVNAGTYNITEAPSTGWQIQSNTCATVVVAESGSAICDITNKKVAINQGKILGSVYEDKNGTGLLLFDILLHRKQPGWVVYIDTNNNSQLDGGEVSTTTNSNGDYSFGGLAAGSYTVREVVQLGWTQTAPWSGKQSVTLASSTDQKSNVNFGNYKPTSISGNVYNDKNGNKNRDSGEPGLAGWTVKIKRVLDGVVFATTTDSQGNYTLKNMGPGIYAVTEVVQSGWKQTTVDPTSFILFSNTPQTGNDFGNKK